MLWTHTRSLRAGFGAVVALTVLLAIATARDRADVQVLTLDQPSAAQSARGGRIAPLSAQAGTEPTCTTPQPIGTWNCQNGVWVAGIGPATGPNGSGPGNCITPSPGVGWSCQNGNWVSSASEAAAGRGTTNNAAVNTGTPNPSDAATAAPSPTTSTTSACLPPAPAPGWTCQNGTWAAPPASLPGGQLPPTMTPAPPVATCPSPAPSATATCQNGMWVIREGPFL